MMGGIYVMVLFEEVVRFLVIKVDGVYMDVIFGCGGYSCCIFVDLNEKGCLVVVDCDFQVIVVGVVINDFCFELVYWVFGEIVEVVCEVGVQDVDGILFDVGVLLL